MTADRPTERAPRPPGTPAERAVRTRHVPGDDSPPAARAEGERGADAAPTGLGTDTAAISPTPRQPRRMEPRPAMPEYKGAELDAARGPGLGCFWFQVIVLAVFVVLIPIGYNLGWPFEVLAILLFVVIGLLLFVGQTLIFLLRLVAADRRTAGRRRPLASATRTVGELEDEQRSRTDHAAEGGGGPAGRGADAAESGADPADDGAVSVDAGADAIDRMADPADHGDDAAEPGPGPGGVRE